MSQGLGKRKGIVVSMRESCFFDHRLGGPIKKAPKSKALALAHIFLKTDWGDWGSGSWIEAISLGNSAPPEVSPTCIPVCFGCKEGSHTLVNGNTLLLEPRSAIAPFAWLIRIVHCLRVAKI